ncbi:recombinase RecA [Rickettsiales bacterium (ex Bugula neritina AB1)]|nr:recombinase RecA [Rickettsiales bacterium (ex Bugula neritina AB1)]
MTKDKKNTIDADNLDNLESIKKHINTSFGNGSIWTSEEKNKENIPFVSTGSMLLNEAIGVGGLPLGRIVEIYGPESSGKTTLALEVIKNAQKNGKICGFIDTEHALDINYCNRIGIDTKNLLISQPDYGEQALEILQNIIERISYQKGGVVVLDSVAALVTKNEIDGDMGDVHIGQLARLMSQSLKKLVSVIAKNNVLVIFTNQLRSKIGVMFGSSETTCGGNALKFYSSVRLDIRRSEYMKKDDKVLGIKSRVKVVKNKVGSPFQESIIEIRYNHGICIENEILDIGTNKNIIEKNGHYYYYNNQKLGQGKESACEFLRSNLDIKNEILEKLISIKI